MPTSCCAVGCTNKHSKDVDLSFYKIPARKTPFEARRRRDWIRAINRKDWDSWTPEMISKERICGAHFVSGKRSDDPENVDWAPTVFNHTESDGYLSKAMSTEQNIVLQNVPLTYKPMLQGHQRTASPVHYATPAQVTRPASSTLPPPPPQNVRPPAGMLSSSMSYQSKYGELLNVIEDLGREIKPTYAGSKMAQERLKKGIMHARALVRECLAEVEKSARQ